MTENISISTFWTLNKCVPRKICITSLSRPRYLCVMARETERRNNNVGVTSVCYTGDTYGTHSEIPL